MRENQRFQLVDQDKYILIQKDYMSILKTDNFLLILKKEESNHFLFFDMPIKVYNNVL